MTVDDWQIPVNFGLGGLVTFLLIGIFTGRLVVKSTMVDRLADKQETINEQKLTIAELRKQIELTFPTMELVQKFIKAIPGVEEVKRNGLHVVESQGQGEATGGERGRRRTAGSGSDGEN